jgi:GNAT superfamily N-acetyltransferase
MATIADLPELLAMARKFFAASGYEELAPFDTGAVYQLLSELIPDNNTVFLVIDEGMLTGMLCARVNPVIFNPEVRVAQEMFWWVEGGTRGAGAGTALLEEAERLCLERGAVGLFCASLARIDWVSKLYQEHGYKLSEKTFLKIFASTEQSAQAAVAAGA